MQRQRIGKVVEQRVESAGKRREEAGDREREPDLAFDRDSQETRTAFVLADGPQSMAERGADQQPEQSDGDRDDSQRKIIELGPARGDIESNCPEPDGLAMEMAQAVEAAGEVVPAIGE